MKILPDDFGELARFREGLYRVFAAAFLPRRPEQLVDLIADCKPLESMELGILSVLCAREAVARAEGRDRRLELALSSQVTFLDRYLDTWPPQFVEPITSMNSIPFHTALGPVVEDDAITIDHRLDAAELMNGSRVLVSAHEPPRDMRRDTIELSITLDRIQPMLGPDHAGAVGLISHH